MDWSNWEFSFSTLPSPTIVRKPPLHFKLISNDADRVKMFFLLFLSWFGHTLVFAHTRPFLGE
jgi:hypothetical protein